jgi:hypothetical protein
MVISYHHFQTRHGDARAGRSFRTREYSSDAHERSGRVAAREHEEATNLRAAVGTEKIERARSVVTTARQKGQATVTSGRQNATFENLKKLPVKENRCLELSDKNETNTWEVPIRRDTAGRRALSSSPHLALKKRASATYSSSRKDDDSLQAFKTLEAKFLYQEEACANLRQLKQSEVSKRDPLVRLMAARRVVSMSCLA